MSMKKTAKSDQKTIKGNNNAPVGYDAKQEKRRELAARLKRSSPDTGRAPKPDASPKKGKKPAS